MAPFLVLLGFLLGSVPFGVLLTRWRRGVDVRAAGSGNIGATNVTRIAGKRLGAAVLLLDALKGALAVSLSLALLPHAPGVTALVGLAAFLGHVFPPWLGFRGGKGVATALGVLLVLVPWAALAGGLVYALLVWRFRVSSVGSLAGGVTAVGTAWVSAPAREFAQLSLGLFALMLLTHRSNIARLVKRTERRF